MESARQIMNLKLVIFLIFLVCNGISQIKTSEPKCEAVTNRSCNWAGFNMTSYPNLVGHQNEGDASLEIHQYQPLIEIQCSEDFRPFLCGVYFSICTEDQASIPPCRSICESSRRGCEPIMNQYSFQWPETLDCEKFPRILMDEESEDSSTTCFDGVNFRKATKKPESVV